MPKYRITYKDKTVFRFAENAVEAVDKICNQYQWTYKINQVDADTRGGQWVEALCDCEGGINYNIRIIATV